MEVNLPHEYPKCLTDVVSYPTDSLDISIGIMFYIKSMTEIWSIQRTTFDNSILSNYFPVSFTKQRIDPKYDLSNVI